MALSRIRSQESRRNSSLIVERRASGVVMIAVLAIAFLSGLIGFAIHMVWIVAIVAMALGLGYLIANSRKERVETLARRENSANIS
jgi:membrane associated rhomboid family serine protease